eukprot:jgi/Ulvmu1/11534/UM078_0023.1
MPDPNASHYLHSLQYKPSIRTMGSPGGWDHMGNDRTLSPQAHLTKINKSGKRHHHDAPWATDHVVFQNNHATWSGMGAQVARNTSGLEQTAPAASSQLQYMQSTSSQPSQASHGCNYEPSQLRMSGSSAQHDACSQGDTVRMLQRSLARHGAHGAVEFALQIRIAASPEDTITFGDLARVVLRFCGLGEAHVHAIFRMLDKDCHGRVAIPPFISTVFVGLSPAQTDVVNQTYEALQKYLNGDMDVRRVLQVLDFKNHPEHLSGRKSKAALFGEFSDLVASNTVSWQAFHLYCRGLATCVSEPDFTQLVQESWPIARRHVQQQPQAMQAGHISSTDRPQPKMQRMFGSIRKFPQAQHAGASPIFNPTAFARDAERTGKLCGIGTSQQSTIIFG